MKSKEEIANKHGILSGKDNEFDKTVLKAMEEYAMQFEEDIVKGIRFLIYRYKSDILLLEEEFRDSSSVLIVEKIVTLTRVITDLEKLI